LSDADPSTIKKDSQILGQMLLSIFIIILEGKLTTLILLYFGYTLWFIKTIKNSLWLGKTKTMSQVKTNCYECTIQGKGYKTIARNPWNYKNT